MIVYIFLFIHSFIHSFICLVIHSIHLFIIILFYLFFHSVVFFLSVGGIQEAWIPGSGVSQHLQHEVVGDIRPLAALCCKLKPEGPTWNTGCLLWHPLTHIAHNSCAARSIAISTQMQSILFLLQENMFSFEVEKERYALKPMNCPGHW